MAPVIVLQEYYLSFGRSYVEENVRVGIQTLEKRLAKCGTDRDLVEIMRHVSEHTEGRIDELHSCAAEALMRF